MIVESWGLIRILPYLYDFSLPLRLALQTECLQSRMLLPLNDFF